MPFKHPVSLGGDASGLRIWFTLPVEGSVTDARRDSVLAANPITVDGRVGEIDTLLERTAPTASWARVAQGGVHVRIE